MAAPPVTFDWSDVAGAASYTIQVDEISQFGAPLILSASTTASQLTTSSLPDGNWFWRVRAVTADGTAGAWSTVRTIQVQSTRRRLPAADAGHRVAGEPGGRRVGDAASSRSTGATSSRPRGT